KPETQRLIENRLYGLSLYSNQDVLDLFTGTIRQGSYIGSSDTTKRPITFLVDIEPIDITYIVTISKFQNEDSINIKCAPEKQQHRQPTVCKELDGIV